MKKQEKNTFSRHEEQSRKEYLLSWHERQIDEERKEYVLSWHERQARKANPLSWLGLLAVWFSQMQVQIYSAGLFVCLAGTIAFTILGIQICKDYPIIAIVVDIVALIFLGGFDGFSFKLKKCWDKFKKIGEQER